MVLADTTAWSWKQRQAYPELRESFNQRLIAGEIATCDMVRLEILYSARTPGEFGELLEDLDALPGIEMDARTWSRALDVYSELGAKRGRRQRSVKHPDLLIAAAAELEGVAVLHYDHDYEIIAAITGQPTEWLAPKGSLR